MNGTRMIFKRVVFGKKIINLKNVGACGFTTTTALHSKFILHGNYRKYE